ncbi:unnamed protein product, partial [Ectocarpus sp. 12 AP-2014]
IWLTLLIGHILVTVCPISKRHSGAQFVEGVLEDSGLNMPLVLLNDGYGSESFKQVDEIRRFVGRSERARLDLLASPRTFTELRSFAAKLANPASRLRTLREEVEQMEASLWHRNLWMACHVVPLAYISVSSPGAGCIWTGPYVKREQEACARLRKELTHKKEEIELDIVDEQELRAAQGVSAFLDYMCA